VEYGSSLFCLTSSLSVRHSNHAVSCIATPLLGSGTGGAPVAAAVKVAAEAVSRLRSCDLHTQLMLRFVSNDSAAFEELIPAFSH
jgi:O-acetyl-ADP-ribose deacetylase (regulator of RNase III)